jgi:hypothetical protein
VAELPPYFQVFEELADCGLENSHLGRGRDWKEGLLSLLSRMSAVICFKLSLAQIGGGCFWVPAQLIVEEIAPHLQSLEYLAFGVSRTDTYRNGGVGPGMTRDPQSRRLNTYPILTCEIQAFVRSRTRHTTVSRGSLPGKRRGTSAAGRCSSTDYYFRASLLPGPNYQ